MIGFFQRLSRLGGNAMLAVYFGCAGLLLPLHLAVTYHCHIGRCSEMGFAMGSLKCGAKAHT